MAKWKCPEDAGPGVSIGGQWFENKDGVIETPEGENFAIALAPFGYTHIPPTAEELAEAAAIAQEAEAKRLAEEAELEAQREADAKAAEVAAAAEAAEKAAAEEAAANAAAGEAEAAKPGKKK